MIGSQHQTANWTLGISRTTVAIPASASTEKESLLSRGCPTRPGGSGSDRQTKRRVHRAACPSYSLSQSEPVAMVPIRARQIHRRPALSGTPVPIGTHPDQGEHVRLHGAHLACCSQPLLIARHNGEQTRSVRFSQPERQSCCVPESLQRAHCARGSGKPPRGYPHARGQCCQPGERRTGDQQAHPFRACQGAVRRKSQGHPVEEGNCAGYTQHHPAPRREL